MSSGHGTGFGSDRLSCRPEPQVYSLARRRFRQHMQQSLRPGTPDVLFPL